MAQSPQPDQPLRTDLVAVGAPTQREVVLAALRDIEAQQGVKIVYACEAGSRAAGLYSADSDYDVRFIYFRKPDWYLSITRGRDVIDQLEYPVRGNYDLAGWDATKALQLIAKSNLGVLEQLFSPVRYIDDDRFTADFRNLAHHCYSARANFESYHRKAVAAFRAIEKETVATPKSYLGCIRDLLAASFIIREHKMPPVNFDELVRAELQTSDPAFEILQRLISQKRSGAGQVHMEKDQILERFVVNHLHGLATVDTDKIPSKLEEPNLDVLFRTLLSIT